MNLPSKSLPISKKFSTLELIGIDESDISLISHKDASFNNIIVNGDLTMSNTFQTTDIKIQTNAHTDYTLRCLDNLGNAQWDINKDYRFLGTTISTFNENLLIVNHLETNILNNFIYVGTTQNSINISGYLTVGNDLTVNGNLILGGTQTIISSESISTTNSLIYLANNNTDDLIDIGFVGTYISLGTTKYTGLYRDHADGVYKLFDNLLIEPINTINEVNIHYSKLKLNSIDINEITYGTTFNINNKIILEDDIYLNDTININDLIFTKNNKIGLNKINPIQDIEIDGSVKIECGITGILSGTHTTNGSLLTGISSSYLTEIFIGDKIMVSNVIYTIRNLISNTELNIYNNFLSNITTTAVILPKIISIHKNLEDNSKFMIDNNGFIGINGDNPEYPLDISITRSNWNQKITNNETNVYLGNDGNGILINNGSNQDTNYSFLCNNDFNTLFKIQNDGKIGINTYTPTEIIDIQSGNAGDGINVCNAKLGIWLGNTNYMSLCHSDLKSISSSYALLQHSSGETFLNCGISKNIHFRCNDNEIMTLSGNGNLNINGDCTINGSLLFSGSLKYSIYNTSANITLNDTMTIINVNTTSANKTITLPLSSSNPGLFYLIIKKSNDNLLILNTTFPDTFEDNGNSIELQNINDRIQIVSNSGIWYSM